mgnify:CR=1 FL=1
MIFPERGIRMHEHRKDEAELLRLPEAGGIPNNPRLPVLLHHGAVPPSDPDAAEALFAAHGWDPAWRNGIYAHHHFHANAHEALAIFRGSVRVRLGGEPGVVLDLRAGDVAVLPAGTGHRNLQQSPDLLVVGAYPRGAPAADHCRGVPEELEDARATVAATADPPCDPVTGRAYPRD